MLPITDAAEAGAATSAGGENAIRVSGFAGRPQLTRANRNLQLFFVNGRAVKNRALQHALQAAYEGLLHGRDRFPVAVVFVQVPPNAVDVNVHPAKSEVRFAREWEVHHAVRAAIRETLVAAQLAPDWGLSNAERGTPNAELTGPFGAAPQSQSPASNVHPADYRGFHQPVAPRGGDMGAFRAAQGGFNSSFGSVNTSAGLGGGSGNGSGNSETPNGHAPNATALPSIEYGPGAAQPDPGSLQRTLPDIAPPAPAEDARKIALRPLAQISNNAYILCEGDDGLYIVCQHRAHERILADRAIAQAEGRPVQSQRLVIPFTTEAGPRALAAIEENDSLLKDLGFEVEAFGGASVLVRAVPTAVAQGDYQTAFADLLDELISGHAGQSLQEKRRALLTMLSCKNAIKAGDALQPEQMKGLLDDLLTLNNPSICPHGQPILIKISTLELDKKFEREYASR